MLSPFFPGCNVTHCALVATISKGKKKEKNNKREKKKAREEKKREIMDHGS